MIQTPHMSSPNLYQSCEKVSNSPIQIVHKRTYLEYVSDKKFDQYKDTKGKGWSSAGNGKPYVPLGMPILDLKLTPKTQLKCKGLKSRKHSNTSSYKQRRFTRYFDTAPKHQFGKELRPFLSSHRHSGDYQCIREQIAISDARRIRAKAGGHPSPNMKIPQTARKYKTPRQKIESKVPATSRSWVDSSNKQQIIVDLTADDDDIERDPVVELANRYIEFGLRKVELLQSLVTEMDDRPNTYRKKLENTKLNL